MSDELRNYGYTHAGQTARSQADIGPIVAARLQGTFGARRARIVDVGCGNGFLTAKLAALGYDVVGIDPAEDGIALARGAYPQVRFEVASVYDDALPDRLGAPVDAVVATEIVEHLVYPKRLFEQARRLLRPGGRLVVSTPYHGYLKNLVLSLSNGWDRHFAVTWDGGHVRFFSKRSLGAMVLGAGFRDIAFHGAGRAPFLWKSVILTATRDP